MEKVQKISTKKEVFRFIITGIACALLDFLVSYGVLALLNLANIYGFLATAISTTLGFAFGVTANYFLSTYWVFKNVSESTNTKSFKFVLAFIILSACAWGLSVGTMELCTWVCRAAWQINIDQGANVIIQKIVTFTFWNDVTFWAYFVSFCLRTLVGLVWNYFTRKKFLYK